MNAIGPTPAMAELMNTVRNLPADLIREVADFAEFLNRRHLDRGGLPVNYSDEWTDEDLRDVTIASLRRFDAENGEENWGEDFTSTGGTGCSSPVT